MRGDELAERLRHLARSCAWFMAALTAVRDLELSSWCIGAGAVRNLVWDAVEQKNYALRWPRVTVVPW